MSLEEQARMINSRQDLAAFVKALHQDIVTNLDGWTNDTLLSYLAAVAAWIDDMDGYFRNRGEDIPTHPDWRLIGEILLAAKYYE